MSAERRPKGQVAAAVFDAEHPVSRFSLADTPEWGEWLIGRLDHKFPGINRGAWLGKLGNILASNEYLFVRNDRCVLLVDAMPRILDGKLVVLETFAFSRDAIAKGAGFEIPHQKYELERPMTALYRHARDWARTKGAVRFFVGQCSDIHPFRLKEVLAAEACGWVSVRL